MQWAGTPIDTEMHSRFVANWTQIQERLIGAVDPGEEIFEGVHFRENRFEAWLQARGIPWPRPPQFILPKADGPAVPQLACYQTDRSGALSVRLLIFEVNRPDFPVRQPVEHHSKVPAYLLDHRVIEAVDVIRAERQLEQFMHGFRGPRGLQWIQANFAVIAARRLVGDPLYPVQHRLVSDGEGRLAPSIARGSFRSVRKPVWYQKNRTVRRDREV